MATVGQTLVRFVGAVFLAAGATRIDRPRPLFTPIRASVQTLPVVVAAKDIPEGVVIDRWAVRVAHWPVGTQPAGAYVSVDSVDHRVSRVPIYKGEAIVPARIAPPGRGVGLEVELTPGKRAYSIRVDDPEALADTIGPNARVDVLVLLRGSKHPNRREAWIVAEDLRVLAIGAQAIRMPDGTSSRARMVTLEIDREDTEFLAIAAQEGQLRLVTRGYRTRASLPRRSLGSPEAPAPIVSPPPGRGDTALVQQLPLFPRVDRLPDVRRATRDAPR